MKKRFTLMLIAALVAVTSFAQPVKRQPLALQQMTLTQRTPSIKPFQTIAQPQAMKQQSALKAKKAPKKAPASFEDIEWPLSTIACSMVYTYNEEGLEVSEIPYAAVPTTIEKTGETTLTFTGLYAEATQPIEAEWDPETMTFTIATDQLLFEDGNYGAIVIKNAESNDPLTGQFNEDGTFSINEYWYAGMTGDYDGYLWAGYYYTPIITEPNGTMDFTNASGVAQSEPVYVYQDPQYGVATVFNFGGQTIGQFEAPVGIDINIKEDGTFQIFPQPLFDWTDYDYGMFKLYGHEDGYITNLMTGTVNENVLTFDADWTVAWQDPSDGNYVWLGAMTGTTITLNEEWAVPVIEDVPAMPADPTFIRINPYNASNQYGSVVVDIPNVDTEGNLLKESKLFYIIYGKNGDEITQIEYPADLYMNIEETFSVIPYTLFDSYDFNVTEDGYKVVFLNFDFNYETMGVQSVYTGGDALNQTEIIWFVPETSELTEAQWVAAEQSYENTQEVTNIVISEEDGITGVFAAEGGTTPKYYTRGESVRMYAGNTLTISSEEYPIERIEIILGTRTDIVLSSDEGDFIVDETADPVVATWEGEANEVVFSIPQGLEPAGQAYIAGINVYYAVPQLVFELIELPDGATVDEYKFVATVSYEQTVYDDETGEATGTATLTEEVERSVFVAFVDDQVYIQGLSETCPDGWAVGTMKDNVLTIPAEYLGEYDYIDWDAQKVYSFDMTIDKVVLNYDPEKDEFTTSSLVVSAYYDGELLGTYEEYADVVITKLLDFAATPADPYFTSYNLDVNDTPYPIVRYTIPTVDTEGNDILTSKLSYIFWVETEEGQSQYTCVAGVYEELDEDLTEIPYTFSDGWDIYNNRLYVYTDAEDFTAWKKIGIQSVYYGGGERHESNIVWEDLTEYWETVGIEDITAADTKSVKFYDLQGRQVTADAKGVIIRVAQMANGSTKTTKMLRK